MRLRSNLEALFSDTVGFIQKLPPQLVAAFAATLEEIRDAAVVLHVLDASAPGAAAQCEAVLKVCGVVCVCVCAVCGVWFVVGGCALFAAVLCARRVVWGAPVRGRAARTAGKGCPPSLPLAPTRPPIVPQLKTHENKKTQNNNHGDPNQSTNNQKVLDGLGVHSAPVITAWNKSDAVADPSALKALAAARNAAAVAAGGLLGASASGGGLGGANGAGATAVISAATGEGVAELLDMIADTLAASMVEMEVCACVCVYVCMCAFAHVHACCVLLCCRRCCFCCVSRPTTTTHAHTHTHYRIASKKHPRP